MHRPISVVVFGIVNFAFAALCVAGLIASVSLFSAGPDSMDSTIRLMHSFPAYTAWLRICIPLGALEALAALAAGIGMLLLRPWARLCSIVYAIYSIVFMVAAVLVNLTLMVQPMFQQARPDQVRAAAAAIGGPLTGTIGAFLLIIYPITLLVFMLRPRVAAAFRPPTSLPT